ncbi:MAG TPA: hypothetical protein H9805_05800 [Candidatus Janibacter merdipullorum]|nr:hypothetical protein [Candidatus Janibacter merdipullorum]
MNPAADPLFVAADVAYRFERDHVTSAPGHEHRGTGRVRGALARLVRPTLHQRSASRARHALAHPR